jgi:hypothetical protein
MGKDWGINNDREIIAIALPQFMKVNPVLLKADFQRTMNVLEEL